MSVPHILADESSAYYHAYVLAEMSVHQTRAHFKRKYGAMVDNPKVSPACLRSCFALTSMLHMERQPPYEVLCTESFAMMNVH